MYDKDVVGCGQSRVVSLAQCIALSVGWWYVGWVQLLPLHLVDMACPKEPKFCHVGMVNGNIVVWVGFWEAKGEVFMGYVKFV